MRGGSVFYFRIRFLLKFVQLYCICSKNMLYLIITENRNQPLTEELKMSRLTIKIKKCDSGYVCEASNGDHPFEGWVHPDRQSASRDIEVAYRSEAWNLRRLYNGNYSIKID
jgi:hypothetical protein